MKHSSNLHLRNPFLLCAFVLVMFLVFSSKIQAASPDAEPSETVTPAPVSAEVPSAPSITEVTAGGKIMILGQPLRVQTGIPLALQGKTVSNGIVTFHISPGSGIATVTANEEGLWNYLIAGLSPGEYRVEAEVTDPATKTTSPRAQLLTFTVLARATGVTQLIASAGNLPLWMWAALVGGVVLLVVLAYLIWRRFQKNSPSSSLPQ